MTPVALTWPLALVVVALIAATTVLGVTHVIAGDWIERTLSALIGAAVMFPLGHLSGRQAERAAGAKASSSSTGDP